MSKSRPNARRVDRSPDQFAAKLALAINRSFTEGRHAFDAARGQDIPALIVARALTPRAPAWTANAQSTDPATRARDRATYEHCLDVYRTLVRPQDTAYDDAGAAAAFFVAVNMNALYDSNASAETMALLERQLLVLVRQISAWDTAPIGDRQFYFEQMAMLGVLVAAKVGSAREQGIPTPPETLAAARSYLRRVLGIDPDLLELGANGLSLRPDAAATRSAA
jgi:Family of unknown function (DUF6683)